MENALPGRGLMNTRPVELSVGTAKITLLNRYGRRRENGSPDSPGSRGDTR